MIRDHKSKQFPRRRTRQIAFLSEKISVKNIIKRTSPNFRKINKNSPSKKQKKRKWINTLSKRKELKETTKRYLN